MKLNQQTTRLAYIFIGIAFAVVATVVLAPIVFNIYGSLFDWRITGAEKSFSGLSNWITIVTGPRWIESIARTLVFVAATVALQIIGGFCCAYLLYKYVGNLSKLAVILLLPMMISEVAAALLWRSLLLGSNGPINWVLNTIGLPSQEWLGATWAFPVVILVDAWMNIPFAVLVIFAAMQSMPTNVLEAASVDGAVGIRRVWYILLPLLQPAILVVLLFRTIFALRAFGLIYTMTGGGPADRTAVLAIEIYRSGFSSFNVGMSSTLSLLMVLISLVVGVTYIRLLSRDELV